MFPGLARGLGIAAMATSLATTAVPDADAQANK